MSLYRDYKMSMKILKLKSSLALFALLSSQAIAIPEGWYIDSYQKHQEIAKWSDKFDSSVVFRKDHEGEDQIVYWGRFDKELDKTYDEIEVFTYFVKDFIPCFDATLIKFDAANKRYAIRCSISDDKEEQNIEQVNVSNDQNANNDEKKQARDPYTEYHAIYKDIDDLGLIVLGQHVSYRDMARLGFDNDPDVQTKENTNSQKSK